MIDLISFYQVFDMLNL